MLDQLIRAMVTTVSHGGQVVLAEVELLRVMAASLHVPLPLAPEGLFDGLE